MENLFLVGSFLRWINVQFPIWVHTETMLLFHVLDHRNSEGGLGAKDTPGEMPEDFRKLRLYSLSSGCLCPPRECILSAFCSQLSIYGLQHQMSTAHSPC